MKVKTERRSYREIFQGTPPNFCFLEQSRELKLGESPEDDRGNGGGLPKAASNGVGYAAESWGRGVKSLAGEGEGVDRNNKRI